MNVSDVSNLAPLLPPLPGANQPGSSINTKTLTWSMVIATYQRPDMLEECIRLGIAQTRQPDEIVIVDGSDNWRATEQRIREMADSAAIPLTYVEATLRSSSAQRNQGMDLASSDIVFLIDDDALMTSDCAEIVLHTYERDVAGAIVGIGMSDANAEDLQRLNSHLVSSESDAIAAPAKEQRASVAWFYREILLMNSRTQWIPYDGDFPHHVIPHELQDMDLEIVNLMSGYQMTFRKSVLQKERFESLVRQYATFEYQDLMNRIQRHGAIVCAHKARLHHAEAAGGRPNRWVVSASQTINQTWYVLQHTTNLKRDRNALLRMAKRRIAADFIKDAMKRRTRFPHTRGAVFGYREARRLSSLPLNEARGYYTDLQAQMVEYNRQHPRL